MNSDLENFLIGARPALPGRNDDELTELFYLLELFKSQYTESDGDFMTYLNARLISYHSMDN